MPREINGKEEWDALLATPGKLIVVDFTATWCGPCKMISPVFTALSEEHKDAIFVKVDVDENEDIVEECGISAMPTFQCFKDGTKVGQMTGAKESELRALVQQHL